MIETLELLDRAVLLKINSLHAPWLDELMWFLSFTWPTVTLIGIVAFVIYRKYTLKKAIEFALGCAIVFACTDLSSNTVKHQVKRFRPTHNTEIQTQVRTLNNYRGGKYTFFSGHAANTFGVVTFLVLCLYWVRLRYRLLFFIYPILVVYSRMYLGVHYPFDVLVGLVCGCFFGWLVFRIMNRYFLHLHASPA